MPTKKTAGTSSTKSADSFTAEERAAMREHAQELRATRARGGQADDESAVLAKIAEFPEPDRSMAERLHALIRATAPALTSRLWYGMPAYAKDGKVLCFFQNASKFKTRYATLGFSDQAQLDAGGMWPTTYALLRLDAEEEKTIKALLKKAVS